MVRSGYNPRTFIERSPRLAEALSLIETGFFSFGEPDRYRDVVNNLTYSDPYLVCADFDAYVAAEAAAAALYTNPLEWSRRALLNIIGGARFSSDETIRQYAQEIWNLKSVRIDPNMMPAD